MEGPTPVSALLHAATMVTAGVYLLMRLSPLLEWSSTSLIVITWLGGLSALFGAACGQLENDLKRVIAFSTTSQLGYYYIIYISLFISLTFILLIYYFYLIVYY